MIQLSIEEIGILRKAAANTARDFPHRPLMLELALVGLSRFAMVSAKVSSFEQNAVLWEGEKKIVYKYAIAWMIKNHVHRKSRLSDSQWQVVMDYMKWRRDEIYVDSPVLFVVKNKEGFWGPMTEWQSRKDFYKLGKCCHVAPNLEVPDLHRSMGNILRFQGVSEEKIQRIYGKKRYAPQPEKPE